MLVLTTERRLIRNMERERRNNSDLKCEDENKKQRERETQNHRTRWVGLSLPGSAAVSGVAAVCGVAVVLRRVSPCQHGGP